MTWDDYYTMLKTCVDESKTLSEEEYDNCCYAMQQSIAVTGEEHSLKMLRTFFIIDDEAEVIQVYDATGDVFMSSTKDKKRAYRALVDEELEGFSKLYDGIDMVQLFSSLRGYMEPAYMDSKDD